MAGLGHPPRLGLVVVTLTAITLGLLGIAQITPAPRTTSSLPSSIVALTPAHTTHVSSAPASPPSTAAPSPSTASTTPTPSGRVGCSPAGWAAPVAANPTGLVTQLERRHGARISLAWWDQSHQARYAAPAFGYEATHHFGVGAEVWPQQFDGTFAALVIVAPPHLTHNPTADA